MSRIVLLLDFGASRIKGAVLSLQDGIFLEFAERASPSPKVGERGEVEVDPHDYWKLLEDVALPLLNKYSIQDLWLCSEMHGFLLYDVKVGTPLTNYISWKDERSSFENDGSPSSIVALKKENKLFREQTGMNIKPGLPFVNLNAIKGEVTQYREPIRFCTLVDWLLICGGENNPGVHETLAAGTGFYSIVNREWSEVLFDMAGIDHRKIIMPRVERCGIKLGCIEVGSHRLDVYGGIGDLQAALYGAGFPDKHHVLINLGTGSQVVTTDLESTDPSVEQRPGVMDERFSAITHIPSGRALNVFAKFVDDLSPTPVFWNTFANLTVNDVKSASVDIGIGVFASSWRYHSGGSISKIGENNFNLKNYVAAVAKSWLNQYKDAIAALCTNKVKSISIAGGLSRRGTFIPQYLAEITAAQVDIEQYDTGEDTLDGLKYLALGAYHEH